MRRGKVIVYSTPTGINPWFEKFEESVLIAEFKDTRWACPTCDYIVSEETMIQSRFDWRCPRCGRANLSQFVGFRRSE